MVCNKCVDIVVGLAAGSEGKGKIVSLISSRYEALVRTGAPNAAHTVYYKGEPVAFHLIPCGSLHAPNAKLILGANSQIDIDYLKKEIQILKNRGCWLDKDGKVRLMIDPHATVIDNVDKFAENGGRMPDCGDLYFHPRDCDNHTKLGDTCIGCNKLPADSAWTKLGSTTHGGGANLIRKITRGTKMAILNGLPFNLNDIIVKRLKLQGIEEPNFDDIKEGAINLALYFERHNRFTGFPDWADGIDVPQVQLACENKFLKEFIAPTAIVLNEMIDKNEPILLEGTQGALLSLHHSYWPKTTSRDTNASNWCSDAGISPFAIKNIYGVTRTTPIRVAGDSGPLSGTEITWDEVAEYATGKPIKKWRLQIEDIKKYLEMKKLSTEERKRIADTDDLFNVEYERLFRDHGMFSIDYLNNLLDEITSKIKKDEIVEITTATKRKRRVFTFGEDDFRKAVYINRPNVLALTFVDYLDINDVNKSSWEDLSQKTRDWITTLESKFDVFFHILSTGPDLEHTIYR